MVICLVICAVAATPSIRQRLSKIMILSSWRSSLVGGEETRILEQGMWGYLALLEQGICFFNQRTPAQPTFEFFNFATSQVKLFGRLELTRAFSGSPGMTVSADGRWILYRQVDQKDNDIMLVENFR
jgi:hypothetical protein